MAVTRPLRPAGGRRRWRGWHAARRRPAGEAANTPARRPTGRLSVWAGCRPPPPPPPPPPMASVSAGRCRPVSRSSEIDSKRRAPRPFCGPPTVVPRAAPARRRGRYGIVRLRNVFVFAGFTVPNWLARASRWGQMGESMRPLPSPIPTDTEERPGLSISSELPRSGGYRESAARNTL